VEIIAMEKDHSKLIAGLPHPFNDAKVKTTWKALGKEININLTICKAIKERIRKSRQS